MEDRKLSTPDMQGWSLLIFILYFAINGSLVINLYLDFKERKSRVNPRS